MRKPSLRAGLKKNLFADLLASDVVPEIETLLGRQAVEDLDLEALELADRACRITEPGDQSRTGLAQTEIRVCGRPDTGSGRKVLGSSPWAHHSH